MQAYVVGGAVRDELLGLPVKDRDWVVVGASPDQMLEQGFRPVGKDFPVFLHPDSGEEYALARTERKTGRGYKGFAFHTSPDVTLEDDLLRRDLTINAIARDQDGHLIDPYGGVRDIEARLFRHVSPAFAEDPVRILRIARFAARFEGFSIAPETLALMRAMVTEGEVDHLVPERVWQEIARGLMEAAPSRMLEVLHDCGALARILPELDQHLRHPSDSATRPPKLTMIDRAARSGASLEARWAVLLHGLADDPESAAGMARDISVRLKAPNDCRDLAVLLARESHVLSRATDLTPEDATAALERMDVLRKPERFALLRRAADHVLRDYADTPTAIDRGRFWERATAAFRSVDAGEIARACPAGERIPERIRAGRTLAIAAAMHDVGRVRH